MCEKSLKDTKNNGEPASVDPESLAVANLSYSVNIGKKNSCWKPRRATCGSLLGPALAKIAGKSLESPEAAAEKEETPVTELKLLNEVTARFKCGRMTALMGQSGAGKSTFLDVVAGYKTGGVITGDIMMMVIQKRIQCGKP